MEKFKIFPSIGITRLGGSPADFFLCPETEASLGIEIDSTGVEHEVKNFKDNSGLIKRQGARFRVFEWKPANNEYQPVDMTVAEVQWSVHLVNKKAAVVRPGAPPISPANLPLPLRPTNPDELIIDGGEQTISGKNSSGTAIRDKYKGEDVYLGDLKTDKEGNLIILGGHGVSKSPSNQPIQNYYYSNDWYDDTADGLVKASIKLSDGISVEAVSAWVVIAPPDYAPDVKGVVTLYDILQQVATDNGTWQLPQTPSFAYDILPILKRFQNLAWVSNYSDYSIPYADDVLADNSPANKSKRREIKIKILGIEDILQGHVNGIKYQLTQNQKTILSKWENGSFDNDLINPINHLSAADQLNKTVLDTTVGQGFCPGIEGGIIVKNPSIYLESFRFNASMVSPGDITGLMALPWQADFLKCNTNWWPTQRPDVIRLKNGTTAGWSRGINGHQSLIDNFNKLGYVKPINVGNNTEQVEDERSL